MWYFTVLLILLILEYLTNTWYEILSQSRLINILNITFKLNIITIFLHAKKFEYLHSYTLVAPIPILREDDRQDKFY